MKEKQNIKTKLNKLIDALSDGLVERREVIQASLLTMLARENLILIGPPGTAKSEISRRLTQVIKDSSYFEYLLTKFTTPEEVFGPLSIKELKEGRFQRNTEGYLPTADIAFLDEIFKANSAILNSLLTIINEHTFHNGSKKDPSPLISLIGASNELPIGNDELSALYDRFLVRKYVGYVSDDSIDELMQAGQKEFKLDDSLKFSRDEIEHLNKEAKKVTIPQKITEIIKNIRLKFNDLYKENSDESLSDRRLVKILKLLRVSAYVNNRKTVDYSDLFLLIDCLWNNPKNQKNDSSFIKKEIKALSKDEYVELSLDQEVAKKLSGSVIENIGGHLPFYNGKTLWQGDHLLPRYVSILSRFECCDQAWSFSQYLDSLNEGLLEYVLGYHIYSELAEAHRSGAKMCKSSGSSIINFETNNTIKAGTTFNMEMYLPDTDEMEQATDIQGNKFWSDLMQGLLEKLSNIELPIMLIADQDIDPYPCSDFNSNYFEVINTETDDLKIWKELRKMVVKRATIGNGTNFDENLFEHVDNIERRENKNKEINSQVKNNIWL